MAILNLGTFDTGNVTLAGLNDALSIEWGYQATIDGQPNPETKAQFNRRQVGRIIKETYKNGKRKGIIAAAEATVPNIIIT